MTDIELITKAAQRAETKIQKVIQYHGDQNGERRELYYFFLVLEEELECMRLEQECILDFVGKQQQQASEKSTVQNMQGSVI